MESDSWDKVFDARPPKPALRTTLEDYSSRHYQSVSVSVVVPYPNDLATAHALQQELAALVAEAGHSVKSVGANWS